MSNMAISLSDQFLNASGILPGFDTAFIVFANWLFGVVFRGLALLEHSGCCWTLLSISPVSGSSGFFSGSLFRIESFLTGGI